MSRPRRLKRAASFVHLERRQECAVCHSRGYGAFDCDGPDHSPVEIQRCDDCQTFASDDAAALTFVRDLEAGDGYAVRECRSLLGVA